MAENARTKLGLGCFRASNLADRRSYNLAPAPSQPTAMRAEITHQVAQLRIITSALLIWMEAACAEQRKLPLRLIKTRGWGWFIDPTSASDASLHKASFQTSGK